MFRTFMALVITLAAVTLLWAGDVQCPLHTYAACYDTGQVSTTGSGAHKWHCSCGDDVWVLP